MHGGGPDSNSWQTLQGTAWKPLGIGLTMDELWEYTYGIL